MKLAKRAGRFGAAFIICAAALWLIAYLFNNTNTTWGSPPSILIGALIIASIDTFSRIREDGGI